MCAWNKEVSVVQTELIYYFLPKVLKFVKQRDSPPIMLRATHPINKMCSIDRSLKLSQK